MPEPHTSALGKEILISSTRNLLPPRRTCSINSFRSILLLKQNSRTLLSPAVRIHTVIRLSPEILRGFGRDGLNNPCRPCRPVALEEFFPFQESPSRVLRW